MPGQLDLLPEFGLKTELQTASGCAGSPQHVMLVCLLAEGHNLRRRPPRPENRDYRGEDDCHEGSRPQPETRDALRQARAQTLASRHGLVGRLGSHGPARRIQTASHVSDYQFAFVKGIAVESPAFVNGV
jgi:hypothetical protein